MVTFIIILIKDFEIQYEYYPEDDHSKKPGIIKIDKINDTIEILRPAEDDIYITHTAAELNSMRDSVNEMRKEEGRSELTEEEWPNATKDDSYYWFAYHAISEITKAYNNGIVLEKGSSAWY
ncbi:MAG: hypothetical protein GYA50_01850 [Eubacteriaceae bacterium]|nr:hypothetical protein [Eubacteriaceae bacterium]